jgi:hypothetical protein
MARKWIGLAFLWMIFLTTALGLFCLLPVQPRFTLPSSRIFFFRLSPDSRSLATLEVDDRYNYGDELGTPKAISLSPDSVFLPTARVSFLKPWIRTELISNCEIFARNKKSLS